MLADVYEKVGGFIIEVDYSRGWAVRRGRVRTYLCSRRCAAALMDECQRHKARRGPVTQLPEETIKVVQLKKKGTLWRRSLHAAGEWLTAWGRVRPHQKSLRPYMVKAQQRFSKAEFLTGR